MLICVSLPIELGRGVPRRVLRAVDVGGRAKGRGSKGKDKGEGNVNGNGGSNGDEGEEGEDVGAIPVKKLEYFGTYLRYFPTNPTSRHCDSDLDIRSHFLSHDVI
jgi:hypothetical protein